MKGHFVIMYLQARDSLRCFVEESVTVPMYHQWCAARRGETNYSLRNTVIVLWDKYVDSERKSVEPEVQSALMLSPFSSTCTCQCIYHLLIVLHRLTIYSAYSTSYVTGSFILQ
jgi:hypothetical protein